MGSRDLDMDAWMNRYRAFAEGVVIMVCPVLLAIALDKVNLKREEHGCVVPIVMLVVAAISLIAGICPSLICRFPNRRPGSPHTVTKCLVPVSSACLVTLSCWIIRLIISDKWSYPAIGILFGLCIMIRTVLYVLSNRHVPAIGHEEHYYSALENSLEFSAGITALLFLGMEGLALEGQINSAKGTHDYLTKPIGASFIACIVGVWLMLLETTPPLLSDDNSISKLAKLFDFLISCAMSLVMFFIMHALMQLHALLLLAPPFLILMVLAFHLAVPTEANNSVGNGEEFKPASLELTKVTFTGFLAVSIPRISNGSLNKCTYWFILLAAGAIVSGLAWRLLTHIKSENFRRTANVASFCTHLCIVIAAVPFTVMAGNALTGLEFK